MKEEYYQFQFLKFLIRYQRNDPESKLFKKYYSSVSLIFDYFFQCLNISRNLRDKYSTDHCATEIEIINFILHSAVNKSNINWLQHRRNCHACNHTHEVYTYLINNIWQVFTGQKQILLANLILAHLHNQSDKKINRLCKNLINHKARLKPTPLIKLPVLKGILVVKESNKKTGKLENISYGLVRRRFDSANSTCCKMFSSNGYDLMFQIDFTPEMDQFYFSLIETSETNGGLRFYFGPNDKLLKQSSRGEFAQHTIGTSKHNCFKKFNWEAIFRGVIN